MNGPGTSIAGKYLVTGELPAREGISHYTATSPDGRAVVVAVVRPTHPDRFLETMRAVGEIDHPHLARVIDQGRLTEGCFVVRDAVDGTDLSTLLATGHEVEPDTACQWGSQAAAGLSALHDRGIVHGGISPESLVRGLDGTIHLVDPGLAVAAGGPMLDQSRPAAAAWYVTPEVALGRPLEPASDIYALGAVLYRLATGVVPFDGPNAEVVAQAQTGRVAPHPKVVRDAVPAALDAVIMRALAKVPDDRYRSADELRTALESVLRNDTASTTIMAPVAAAAKSKKKVWPWVVGALVALAAIAVVLWATGVFGSTGIKVPDVKGMTVPEATGKLEGAKLKVGDIAYQQATSADQTPGTVVGQKPAAGKEVDKGSAVDLTVVGSALVVVPALKGMTETEAGSAITTAGLKLDKVVRAYDDTVAVGVVLSQTPDAGTQVPSGSTVALVVSSGPVPAQSPTTTVVPSVIGKAQADAVKTLQDAGFGVAVQNVNSGTVPAGFVVSQAPAPGVQMDPGSSVVISVSQGPSPTTPTPSTAP